MSPLIKKEIRLVFPAAIVALLLALPAMVTRRDDPFPIYLLFVGMVMMALSSFGRETSLNTFSALLAQPAERSKIWQTKLAVLFGAFTLVFLVWFFAEWAARAGEADAAAAVFYSGPFVAVATFTGGLWTTLLLRQLAGAFWLTMLVPVVLASVAGGFLSYTFSDSDSAVYAGLAILLLAYSLGGFFFARRLFFRAQDIGWTGGAINLSGLTFGSRAGTAETNRVWRPFATLLKKEIKLQTASLVCAAALLVFHIGVIILRHLHHFQPESAGGVLTSIVWMIWLVFPLFISCLAVAEERRMGVMESQLCLPVSRRQQFAVKSMFTLLLGIFLGAVVPFTLEYLSNNSIWHDAQNALLYLSLISCWFAVAGFFGSSLARHFLQAIGYSIVTIVLCSFTLSVFMNGHMYLFDHIQPQFLLMTLIGVPVLMFTLLWLSWLNFKNFREGWPLWRRSLIGYITAFVFIGVAAPTIYNRTWEKFLPAEPGHGAARMPVTGSGVILHSHWGDLTARLPDGRFWIAHYNHATPMDSWRTLAAPYSKMIAAPHFVAGSNWLSVAAGYEDFRLSDREERNLAASDPNDHITGYRDVVGIRNDGTLWVSDPSPDGRWMGDHMQRFGRDTNWLQVVNFKDGVVLLKTDGTLWQWGPLVFGWTNFPHAWPTFQDYQPVRFGTNSDWVALHAEMNLARKSDGTVWWFNWERKKNRTSFFPAQELASAAFDALSSESLIGQNRTYVDLNGQLWADLSFMSKTNVNRMLQTGFMQIGSATNWISSATTWERLDAVKSDGSLWQWDIDNRSETSIHQFPTTAPERLSAYSDYVAVLRNNWAYSDIITLSTDGSLLLWPDPHWSSYEALLKPSRRPHCIGNIFMATN